MRENSFSQHMAKDENIKKPAVRTGKKPPKKITEKYLYNSGLAYLQRFPTSTAHFRKIMERKIKRSCNYHKDQSLEVCNAFLTQTIVGFERMGLLNDEAYLAGMVHSLRSRGLSTQAILFKLQQKGMPSPMVTNVLKDYDDGEHGTDAELVAALTICRKKRLGPYRRVEQCDRNKELAALARSGFSFDIAQKALDMDPDEAFGLVSSARL